MDKLLTLILIFYFVIGAIHLISSNLKTTGGWNQFAIAFLVGGLGGAFFAFQIYDHLDVLQALLSSGV